MRARAGARPDEQGEAFGAVKELGGVLDGRLLRPAHRAAQAEPGRPPVRHLALTQVAGTVRTATPLRPKAVRTAVSSICGSSRAR